MWTARSEKLPEAGGLRFIFHLDSRPATFAEVIRAWQSDTDFRAMFNSLLADAPFTAYRWETPAITDTTAARPFEFVVLESSGLDRRPDEAAFAEFFAGAKNDVAVFANLGGDATLIVPCPVVVPAAYGHLAAFVRLAPQVQRHDLWRSVGEAMMRRIGVEPVWLSTAGAGVSWLHVRLDDRPKYYGYEPYRVRPA